MNTLARLVCLLVIAAGATVSRVAAAAGDPANGAALYSANCAKCHALPPVHVVLRAADPAVLQDAIASVPQMSVQPNLLALTLAQITDISAYIATFVTLRRPPTTRACGGMRPPIGVGLGHQFRASGRHDICFVVHVRHHRARAVGS